MRQAFVSRCECPISIIKFQKFNYTCQLSEKHETLPHIHYSQKSQSKTPTFVSRDKKRISKYLCQMSFYSISTLHAWNVRLVPLIGFPLNALLFWLVWTKTPKEMRVHSRILLQTCSVDFIYLTITLALMPLVIDHDSISVLFLDGYFTRTLAFLFNYDQKCLIILNLLVDICYAFEIYSASVQFAYRYLILARNMKITFNRYLLMLTVPFIAALFNGTFYFYALSIGRTLTLNAELRASLNDYIDWDNSIYVIYESKNEVSMAMKLIIWIFLFSSSLLIIIFYSINVVCGIKVVKFVGAHVGFNPGMKELNQQLTKSLIVLALFPLLSLLNNILTIVLLMAQDITGISMLSTIIMYEQYFSYLLGNWVPVVNPLVSIWINRPYRDAVKKFIANIFRKNIVATVVHPLNQ